MIDDVVTSCDCTTAQWPRTPTAPGDSLVLTLSIDEKQKGEMFRTATVHCNTPDSPIEIEVNGTVI